MKYLLSSKIYPSVNGIYEKRYGNIYLYHNTSNNNYKLYYDNDKFIWKIGVLGETPLYISEKTTSIEVFKAIWLDHIK